MKNHYALVIFVASLGPVHVPIVSAQSDNRNAPAVSSRAETSDKRAESSTGNAQNTTATAARLDSGTLLVVELTSSLNTKKLRPGDKVTAKIAQAVVLKGKVVIPEGAKLAGNVTETKARSKEDPESRLGIIFAKATTKDGTEYTLDAVIQALAPALPSGVDRADLMMPPANTSSASQPMGAGAGNQRAVLQSPRATVSAPLNARISPETTPNSKAQHPGNQTLSTGSRGVFGFPALTLKATGDARIQVIASTKENVKLESGTQMVLKVTDSAQ